MEFERAHPISVKRGIDKALQVVLQYLKEISMPVTQPSELENLCKIASNQNLVVAEVVAQTLAMVGLEGVVNMTESSNGFTRFALVNDFVLERGFVSDLFTEDEEGKQLGPERMVELEQPLVLVVSDRITEVSEIVPVMEMVKATKRPLIVFCEDM